MYMYKKQHILKNTTHSNVMAPYCNTPIFRRNEPIFPALLQKPLTQLLKKVLLEGFKADDFSQGSDDIKM